MVKAQGGSQTAPALGDAMDLKEFFLAQKQAEHESTITVYEKIPHDRLEWRPAEGMLTLGQMARHVWRSEEGSRRIALNADWTYYEKRIPLGLLAVLGEVKSLDDELREMRRVNQDTLRAVQAFPVERWDEIRENAQYHTRRPAGEMLFRIIEHQVHHRAQVGTYLRILTGKRASPYAV
jgi:uncharacterized damage-inducible protein DinB